MDIEKLLSQMTAEEKAALVAGTDVMYTNPIPRLGIPSLRMSDGPHGLRVPKDNDITGGANSEPATAFPTAAATASGWNPENTFRMGQAIGRECRYYGIHTLLGPGVNIKRNPLCGRNFEYFSEDPLLAGAMGASQIEGLRSVGVAASLKHFALNNSENFRFMGNSVASENTIRKLYLKQFEYIIKRANPAAVMCAYNKINGTFCSQNKWLLTDILRDEWGYEGLVMSDWGAVDDRIAGLKAGLDLEMPGDTAYCRRLILDSIADGSLEMKTLDKACRNILRWVDEYYKPADRSLVDFEENHALAGEIAADCAVLMKNDGTLPLTGREKLRIEGELFSNMRYQGAGSSLINPTKVTTPKDAFDERGIKSCTLEESDVALVFAGLTDYYETEGCDRTDMRLPKDQLDMIDRLCGSGKKVVVVLFGGSPVELPFFDKVSAILNMYLPGQNGGAAVAQLLFGEKNPSGKLAETWPLRYEDVPSHENFSKELDEVYAEGVEVGYRYYNKRDIPVRCPFGYGLSYTTFEHTEWEKRGNEYVCAITNTGDRYGGEVAQLFIDGELRGFKKVYLEPQESVTVSITPQPEDTSSYPDDIPVVEETEKLPLTVASRFTDFRLTFFGRIIYNAVMSYPKKQSKAASKLPDGHEKYNRLKDAYLLRLTLENNCLRFISMTTGDKMPFNRAQALAELANGRILKAAKCLMSKIKVPKLPKDE